MRTLQKILVIFLFSLFCFTAPVLAIINDDTYQFESSLIEDLRNETKKAKNPTDYDLSNTVSRTSIDFKQALQPYTHINLKDGYRLDGFFLSEGMGSFSVPVVIPQDELFYLIYSNETPDGSVHPPFIQYYAGTKNGTILEISDSIVIAMPDHADRQIMNYFEGDNSPESYLEASVFLREIDAIDAGWHAMIGWPIQVVLPYEGTPSVIMNKTHAIVKITTTEEYCGRLSTYQYVDTYTRPNLNPLSEKILLNEEKGGGYCF